MTESDRESGGVGFDFDLRRRAVLQRTARDASTSGDDVLGVEGLAVRVGSAGRQARARTPAPGSSSTRTRSRPDGTPRATSSSTTSRSPAGTRSSGGSARASRSPTSARLNGTYVNREPVEVVAADQRRRGADRQVPSGVPVRRPGPGRHGVMTPAGLPADRQRRRTTATYRVRATTAALAADAPTRRADHRRRPDRLKPEFPDVTISKIRFLESEGLVTPQRTPSGYRQFSAGRCRAAAVRAGRAAGPLPAAEGHQGPARRHRPRAGASAPQRPAAALAACSPTARRRGTSPPAPEVPDDPRRAARRVRADRHLAGRAGAVRALIAAGPGGYFDADAVQVARTAAELLAVGLEPRHLRSFRTAADREATLVTQLSRPRPISATPMPGSARAPRPPPAARASMLSAAAAHQLVEGRDYAAISVARLPADREHVAGIGCRPRADRPLRPACSVSK